MATLLFLQNVEYEFLGPAYISSRVKSLGHKCHLSIGKKFDDFRNSINKYKPDIVGFSIMTGSHLWALDIARKIRKEFGIPNIFGGAHPTFFKEFCTDKSVDYAVAGEAEDTVAEILQHIDLKREIKNIPNLYYFKNSKIHEAPLRNLEPDPDIFPFPDRNLFDEAIMKKGSLSVRNVLTTRGCPFHCSFCFEDSLRELYKGKGRFIRTRKTGKVIEECLELKNRYNVSVIYFSDDVFGLNKKWLYEFLERYKMEVNLPFICLVRADIVSKYSEYSCRLKSAGCQTVFFGIETGNEILRNHILRKNLTNEQIIQAAKNLHDAGIPFRTYNILGLPDETTDDAFSTLNLNIQIKTDYPWCSIYSPLPGTELTRYAVQKGYLDKNFSYDQLSRSFFLNSRLNIPSIQEISNLQKFFQSGIKFPFLIPFIKKAIKLKPNKFFILWFGIFYFYFFVKSERRNFFDTLIFAFKNFREILGKTEKP